MSQAALTCQPRRCQCSETQPATALAERAIARVNSSDAARVPRRTVPDPKSSPPPFGELSGGRHYRPGGCLPLPACQRGASSGRTDSNCLPAPRRAGQFVEKPHPFSPVAQRQLHVHPSPAPSGSFRAFPLRWLPLLRLDRAKTVLIALFCSRSF